MHHKTISEIADDLAEKRYSCVELAEHFLQRIEKHKALNAFITVTREQALAEAKQADQLRHANKASRFTGIPIAHKDIFCTKGVKTSCASKMLDSFISPYNATVVEKMQQHGFITLGKTNMDEFAMGSSNETSYYGPCKNPWDSSLVPGGSSGGSAIAVAARLAPGATGTDTGGSIRQPAALCGITGIKPTYGRVSRYGMIAFASSLDQGGPMAQSAEDCALLLETMAGFDPRDSTSFDQPVPAYSQLIQQPLTNLKIGLPKEYFDNLSPEMEKLLLQVIDVLKSLGAQIVELSLPSLPLSVPVYYVVASAECSSNLSRFDGVRYGYRCDEPKDLMDLYVRSRTEGFGTEVKRRIMLGTYTLSAGYFDAYYIKAQRVRQLIAQDFAKAFEQVDVILGPTVPAPAFKLGEKNSDPVQMYLNDIYTIAANMAGLPALNMPCGYIQGLPVGAQLIGPLYREDSILQVAHQYQQQSDWHRHLPKEVQ